MKALPSFILLLILMSCSSYSRRKLTITRSINGTEAINTRGLYYRTYEQEGKTYTVAFFLYQNGVVYGAWNLQGAVENSIDQIPDPSLNIVYYWGIYQVIDNQLTIEKWVSGDSFSPYPTWTYRATILSDTTLVFENENLGTMHLYPLIEKPDSTNPFIK